MDDEIKTYYLKLPLRLSRELRHLSIETGKTMNAVMVTALDEFLKAERASHEDGGDFGAPA